MPMPQDRVILDISFGNFEYAIDVCLERCNTAEDCRRLASEILRVMKIRQRKESTYRNKCGAIATARKQRW